MLLFGLDVCLLLQIGPLPLPTLACASAAMLTGFWGPCREAEAGGQGICSLPVMPHHPSSSQGVLPRCSLPALCLGCGHCFSPILFRLGVGVAPPCHYTPGWVLHHLLRFPYPLPTPSLTVTLLDSLQVSLSFCWDRNTTHHF